MRRRILFLIVCLSSVASVTNSQAQSAEQARLVVQTGHNVFVTGVAFSPDGKTLASGSADKTVKLWDLASGTELRTFKGHSDFVYFVTFSPDGKTLVSVSDSDSGEAWTIKLWDIANGAELRSLDGNGSLIHVAFSPDGMTLVLGGPGSMVNLLDVHSWTALPPLRGHRDRVHSVAFSPDGKTLASGSADQTIKLWDFSTRKELRTLKGHSDSVESVAFSPDGKTLVSGSQDNTVRLWDVDGGTELRTLKGHEGWVLSVALSPDGKTLASAGVDRAIKIWDVANGTELHSLKGSPNHVSSVAFSPDGKMLASGSDWITMWNVAAGTELRSFKGHSDWVIALSFSPNGKVIASIGNGSAISFWNLDGGTNSRSPKGQCKGRSSLAFSPDGKLLATNSEDSTIKLWEVATCTELRSLKGHADAVSSLAFSPDGKNLASGSADNTIKLWDVANGTELRSFRGHSEPVHSVAFSPDGKVLASGSQDYTIKLWDVASGTQLHSLTGYSWFRSVAFSPDGRLLASGSADNRIELWDVATGAELRSLGGSGLNPIGSTVAFSPSDVLTVASGSADNSVKLWEMASGTELRSLKGHSDWVFSVAFSPDGKTLASAGADTYLKFWRVADGTELASLIALDENDWAVITPNGLFDASPGARKLMPYVVGLEVVTLDQMKDLYYVPGLLQKVIKGEPLPKVQLFTAQDLFPEAEYQQLEPGQTTFKVKLRNRGGGIGRAQLLVNGTEVIVDARPAGFDSQAKEVTLNIDLSSVKQIVPGKANKVEVVARNATGSLNSRNSARGLELVVVGGGRALTAAPELYAVIGGVADYVDNRLHLLYSAKDAGDFARALEIGATKFLGSDKVHIRLLTTAGQEPGKPGSPLSGPDSNSMDATKENFRKAFAEFAAKAKQNDLLVVYLSGHGLALKLNQNPSQAGGDAYLYLTREAYTTEPSAFADEKIRTATTVSGDELVRWIKDIAAQSKALVLDTCAAGAAAESLIARKDEPTDAIKIRAVDHLKDTTGFFILMGSAGDKVSYEATPYRQGLLTYSLLEALKGARLHDGGYANVGQLFGYAQDHVPFIAGKMGLSQQPRFLVPEVGTPFDVGLYTDVEQKLFSLPNPNPLILRPSLQNKDLGYDNLKLLPILNKALLEASYANVRGGEQAALVFVDTSEMLEAFTPSGSYTVSGKQVTIKLNLIRNEKLAAMVTVTGIVTDEASKGLLIQELVAAISTEARKLVKLDKPL